MRVPFSRSTMKRIIWPTVAVLVLGAGYWYYNKRKKDKMAQQTGQIQTAAVERRDITVSVAALGDLEPLTTVEVKANVAGEIVELAVDRGDRVEEGDLIARIDPTETRTQFDQAAADVTAATARVQESSAELRRQRRTTAAQISAASDGITTADARVKQAESNLAYQRTVTDVDILRSEQSLEATQARLRQAEARAAAQPELTAASIRRADADLESAQQALRKLTRATHPQERASVEAQFTTAKITLETDRGNLERIKQLHARGGASLRELETAQTTYASSQDRFASAQAASQALPDKHAAELAEAQARVRQSEASLDTARSNQVDVDIAQEELVSARASVREAEASLAAAKAGKAQDTIREQELLASRASAKEARSQLSVARANSLSADKSAFQLTQAKAQTKRSEAQLENATKNLGYTTVKAPRDGLVVDRYVEQGTVITSGRSSITQGTSIITMADVGRMFVLTDVDEADIGQVKVGQPAQVESETFPGEVFQGKVVQVYPRGQEEQQVIVFKVRVEITKPPAKLRPGMTAEVTIIIASRKNVLAVPVDAVFEREGTSIAEIMVEGESKQVPVKTGISDYEFIEIIEGLKEGDQVVLEPSVGGPGGPGEGSRNMRRMMRSVGRR